jgi:hypothetical protein
VATRNGLYTCLVYFTNKTASWTKMYTEPL